MKKIFNGIGLLVAVFSIFFFLLVADKIVYHNDETVYDLELSHNISSDLLSEVAKETYVMIRLVDSKNISFGKNELDVTFINPDSTVSVGKQSSVFPKDNINYYVYNEKEKSKNIKFFTIQSNSEKKINNLMRSLEKKGYSVNIHKNETVDFNLGMLFSSLNLEFFSLLTLLIILSIATYYVHRLKEIGIKKLHGWNNRKISFNLLFKLSIHAYVSSLFLAIPFSIYIMINDISKIILYGRIYFLLCFFLGLVFLLSALIGTLYIYKVNQVGAIKNKRNNKVLFYSLLTFKFAIVTLLLFSLNTAITDINKLKSSIQSIDVLQKNDLYKIQTSAIPETKLHKTLDQFINTINDENLYNYSPPDELLNVTRLKQHQSTNKLRGIDNFAFTSISSNVLELIDIVDKNGQHLSSSVIQANTLLVPTHYKSETKTILNNLQLDKSTEIIYVQDGQVQESILWPELYVYDSVYYVHDLKKKLYLNSGEVLFDNKSSKVIEKELTNLGIDANSIRVDSLDKEYNIFKGNLELNLFESLFHLIINLLSFLLCILSIVTIFLELRKKEFGVYRLLGKYPVTSIRKFMILNGIITIGISLIVNPIFLILFIIEALIYSVLIYQYINRKAILAIKGE